MFTVACTRFNKVTLLENQLYRQITNCEGCIYGTPRKIRDTIPTSCNIFVLEMNNDTNSIEGIGLIINESIVDKYYRIYNERDYNRNIYKGKYYVSKNTIVDANEIRLIESLEKQLFKGARHSKRGQGITQLPNWILHGETAIDYVKELKAIVKKYTIQQTNVNSGITNTNVNSGITNTNVNSINLLS